MYFEGYEDLCKSNTVITDGDWHHVAAIYDGSLIKIFVDGDLENTCDGGVLLSQDQSSPITLGVYRSVTSNYQSNGSLYELTIWNTSLSDQHVTDLLSIDTVSNSNSLIAHYKFNSGNGDILYDHSGNANHGEIIGASWDSGFIEPLTLVTFAVNMREFADSDYYQKVFILLVVILVIEQMRLMIKLVLKCLMTMAISYMK